MIFIYVQYVIALARILLHQNVRPVMPGGRFFVPCGGMCGLPVLTGRLPAVSAICLLPRRQKSALALCNVIGYILIMIKTFAHKGLETFFLTGSTKGIQPRHARRLGMILDLLDSACTPSDMNFPGSRLHMLKGELEGLWSVTVSANWRLTFRFQDGNAYVVDYQDYH